MRGCRPFPAYPKADQNTQTNLYSYQYVRSDAGGHGHGDTIADGHTAAYGYARACGYGHTGAYGYAGTHRHARTTPTTDQHARTNGPTSTPCNPGA